MLSFSLSTQSASSDKTNNEEVIIITISSRKSENSSFNTKYKWHTCANIKEENNEITLFSMGCRGLANYRTRKKRFKLH